MKFTTIIVFLMMFVSTCFATEKVWTNEDFEKYNKPKKKSTTRNLKKKTTDTDSYLPKGRRDGKYTYYGQYSSDFACRLAGAKLASQHSECHESGNDAVVCTNVHGGYISIMCINRTFRNANLKMTTCDN